MVKDDQITPSLDSIVVRGRFKVPNSNLERIQALVRSQFRVSERGIVEKGRNTYNVLLNPDCYASRFKRGDGKWFDSIKKVRPGFPFNISILVLDKQLKESTVAVECRPSMYYRITQLDEIKYPEHVVQEAQIDCAQVASELVIGVLEGQEIVPLSVSAGIRKGEIRNKLTKLGLQDIIRCLDDSERHMAQHSYEECLHKSRTAFEKMIEYVMVKRRVELTDQASNNIERLRKGFLDDDSAGLLKQLYHYLSNVGTHEKGVKPDVFMAQLGYGFTIAILEYLLDKL